MRIVGRSSQRRENPAGTEDLYEDEKWVQCGQCEQWRRCTETFCETDKFHCKDFYTDGCAHAPDPFSVFPSPGEKSYSKTLDLDFGKQEDSRQGCLYLLDKIPKNGAYKRTKKKADLQADFKAAETLEQLKQALCSVWSNVLFKIEPSEDLYSEERDGIIHGTGSVSLQEVSDLGWYIEESIDWEKMHRATARNGGQSLRSSAREHHPDNDRLVGGPEVLRGAARASGEKVVDPEHEQMDSGKVHERVDEHEQIDEQMDEDDSERMLEDEQIMMVQSNVVEQSCERLPTGPPSTTGQSHDAGSGPSPRPYDHAAGGGDSHFSSVSPIAPIAPVSRFFDACHVAPGAGWARGGDSGAGAGGSAFTQATGQQHRRSGPDPAASAHLPRGGQPPRSSRAEQQPPISSRVEGARGLPPGSSGSQDLQQDLFKVFRRHLHAGPEWRDWECGQKVLDRQLGSLAASVAGRLSSLAARHTRLVAWRNQLDREVLTKSDSVAELDRTIEQFRSNRERLLEKMSGHHTASLRIQQLGSYLQTFGDEEDPSTSTFKLRLAGHQQERDDASQQVKELLPAVLEPAAAQVVMAELLTQWMQAAGHNEAETTMVKSACDEREKALRQLKASLEEQHAQSLFDRQCFDESLSHEPEASEVVDYLSTPPPPPPPDLGPIIVGGRLGGPVRQIPGPAPAPARRTQSEAWNDSDLGVPAAFAGNDSEDTDFTVTSNDNSDLSPPSGGRGSHGATTINLTPSPSHRRKRRERPCESFEAVSPGLGPDTDSRHSHGHAKEIVTSRCACCFPTTEKGLL